MFKHSLTISQLYHRSTDDLLTAWVACKSVVNPRSHLDLGCGIGTVLLMTRWFFSDVESYQGVGVEAQKVSF
jgi:tRNA1(Val) A37 N6-methylase TrmN6